VNLEFPSNRFGAPRPQATLSTVTVRRMAPGSDELFTVEFHVSFTPAALTDDEMASLTCRFIAFHTSSLILLRLFLTFFYLSVFRGCERNPNSQIKDAYSCLLLYFSI